MARRLPRFAEKMEGLLDASSKINRAELARRLDVDPMKVTRLVRGQPAAYDELLSIAAIFNVDPAWLMDESQPWRDPPPAPGETLTAQQFTDELHRRYVEKARELVGLYEQAEAVDWEAVWSVVSKLEPGDAIPEEVADAAALARKLGEFPHVKLSDLEVTNNRDVGKALEAVGIEREQLTYAELLSRTLRLRKTRYDSVAGHLRAIEIGHAFAKAKKASGDMIGSL